MKTTDLKGLNPAARAAALRNIVHGQDMGSSKTWCGIKIVPRGQVGQWPVTTPRKSWVECKQCLVSWDESFVKEAAKQERLSNKA